jgi:hypothetical protein
MSIRNKSRAWALGCLGLLLVTGCFKGTVAPDFDPLRTEVEILYLNYHELKAVHSDLHDSARRHIEKAGGQLSEIQSAARFIDQANLIAYYQWQLLSITEYIRESARSDFFTLRVRDVADAREKSKGLIMAISVYEAFIRDDEALALIRKGIDHIQRNIDIYIRLQEKMAPLANPPGVWGRVSTADGDLMARR